MPSQTALDDLVEYGPKKYMNAKRIDTRPSNLVTHGSTIRARTRLASESGRVPAYSTLRWPILTSCGDHLFIKHGVRILLQTALIIFFLI